MADVQSNEISVLYVDDDVLACRVFAHQLSRRGHHVDAVSTVNKAIERIAGRHYDVVISDLIMPGVDGIEVIKTLQELIPRAAFIIVSGMPEREVHAECETRGVAVASIIGKPLHPDTVDAAIKSAGQGDERHERRGAVLVLDPDMGEGLLAACHIERLGWEPSRVHTCTSAEDALDELARDDFEVVVVGVDAASASDDVVESLRQAAPSAAVVVLTAGGEAPEAETGATPAVAEVLPKTPLTYATLEHAIRSAVRRNTSRRIAAASGRDPVTETMQTPLFARRGNEAMQDATRDGKRLGVVMVEVTNADAVRSALGANAGDQLLVHVADQIRLNFGDELPIVRATPNRFAFVLESIADDNAVEEAIDKLLVALRPQVTVSGQPADIQVDVGAAISRAGESFDQVMRRAEQSETQDTPWVVQTSSWFSPGDRGGVGALPAAKLMFQTGR